MPRDASIAPSPPRRPYGRSFRNLTSTFKRLQITPLRSDMGNT